MTGDHALLCVELAVLRVRDSEMHRTPSDFSLIRALSAIADELNKLREDYAAASLIAEKGNR